ncbi:hypothetical protein G7046_g9093 [Stylonectria norvegica]|nr:hypothetical protein G7046_g9093 [Stylonectria norvegica]
MHGSVHNERLAAAHRLDWASSSQNEDWHDSLWTAKGSAAPLVLCQPRLLYATSNQAPEHKSGPELLARGFGAWVAQRRHWCTVLAADPAGRPSDPSKGIQRASRIRRTRQVASSWER